MNFDEKKPYLQKTAIYIIPQHATLFFANQMGQKELFVVFLVKAQALSMSEEQGGCPRCYG